ncbi:hypothetical protein ACWEWI_26220 [Streptomyces sp. NPDC003753]
MLEVRLIQLDGGRQVVVHRQSSFMPQDVVLNVSPSASELALPNILPTLMTSSILPRSLLLTVVGESPKLTCTFRPSMAEWCAHVFHHLDLHALGGLVLDDQEQLPVGEEDGVLVLGELRDVRGALVLLEEGDLVDDARLPERGGWRGHEVRRPPDGVLVLLDRRLRLGGEGAAIPFVQRRGVEASEYRIMTVIVCRC